MRNLICSTLAAIALFAAVLDASAQKLPFQGQLLENGTPVTGAKDFVFTIPDGGGGTLWTETHTDVAVQDGLYSVVLGNTTPLPADLFSGVDSRTMEISVDATDLTPIEIYPSLTKIEDLNYPAVVGGDFTGLNISQSVNGDVTAATRTLRVTATGEGAGNGDQIALFSQASGNNRLYNTGVWGRAVGTGNGQDGSENYGVYGEARNNTKSNVGTSGVAGGTSEKNVGVYGQASGGTENWAGWFDGDVKITGNLTIDGGFEVPAEFEKTIDLGEAEKAAALNARISGNGAEGNIASRHDGVYGETSASNSFTSGVHGLAQRNAAGDYFSIGLLGEVLPNAAGSSGGVSYGVRGEVVSGDHGPQAMAFRGISQNTNADTNPQGIFSNSGGVFSAIDNPNINIGVVGDGRGNATATSVSYGVWGQAVNANTVKNVGVYGKALGSTGENWAGWFDGSVLVTGDFKGQFLGSYNPNALGENMGDWRVITGFNYFDGNIDNGLISVFGPRDDGEGKRVVISSRGATSAESYGELELDGFQGQPKALLTASGQSGELRLFGQSGGTSVRLRSGGPTPDWGRVQFYNNQSQLKAEMGSFGDDSGFLILNAPDESRNIQIGGSDGDRNKGMMRIFGSQPAGFNPLVDLEVQNDGEAEIGVIHLRSTAGNSIRMDANGAQFNGVGIGDKSWEPGLNGFFHMYGDTPEGTNNYRGGIEVDRDQAGNTFGSMNLHGPVFTDANNPNSPRNFVRASVGRDPNGQAPDEWAGQIQTWGQESPNVFIEGQNYADSDLGQINIFGNQPDGNGWWHSHATLGVGSQNGDQFGTLSLRGNNGKENVTIGAKSWETHGENPGGRPFMKMRGNTPDVDLIWMDVSDIGDGLETGGINFRRSDNLQQFSLGSYGFSSTRNNFNMFSLNSFENNGTYSSSFYLGSSSEGHGITMYGGNDFNSDGFVRSHISLDDAGDNYVHLWGDGNISASGNITSPNISQLSDRGLKENITPLQNSLSKTLQLRGVSYNWIDKAKSQRVQIGVIAQELEQVYPEFVHTDDQGMKSVNYSQMVAVLIEAIKELNSQIETLKTENASLKSELATATSNEKRITELEASVKALVGLLQAPSKPSEASNTSLGKQE